MGVGLGLRFGLGFTDFEVDLGVFGVVVVVLVLDFAGVGDRNLEGVLGVRGVLGVGGSRLIK